MFGRILFFCAFSPSYRGSNPATISAGQKLNTNIFFLKLFGHPRDIPAKSRAIPPKKFDLPGFEGHTELFGPTHSRGRPPPHPKISGVKSLGLGSSFVPEIGEQSVPPRDSPNNHAQTVRWGICKLRAILLVGNLWLPRRQYRLGPPRQEDQQA